MLYRAFRPLLFSLSPERAHDLAIKALASGAVPKQLRFEHPMLETGLAGLQLPNPVGLAAGFDKNAQTIPHIFSQGFGFVEVGTLTPKAQPGNAKPRVFRDVDAQAIINRLGFNNDGLDAALKRLGKPRAGLVGLNVGKNKTSEDAIADYVHGVEHGYGLADYITINISSPNTQGLRDLQQAESLLTLIRAVLNVRDAKRANGEGLKPIFVKIAPDLSESELESIAQVVMEEKPDGVIVSNTTISRPEILQEAIAKEQGGVSGKPLFTLSTHALKRIYQLTEAQVPLIGVGGISSAEDAYAKIRAGASAVQLYTALVYQGFDVVTNIKRGLVKMLERDGFKSVQQAIGVDSK